MKRRALLTSMGVGMAGLTGCLNGNSNSGGNTPQEDVGTPVAVSTPKGKKANFDVEINIGQEIAQVGKEYEFEVTVTNTGGQPGVYRAPVETKMGDSSEYETQTTAMVYVEPGMTKEAVVRLPPFEEAGTVNVRFGSLEKPWSVDIVGPEVPIGEAVEIDSFRISVEEIEFSEAVTYGGGRVSARNSGNKLAVVTLKIDSYLRNRIMTSSENYHLLHNGTRKGAITQRGYSLKTLSEGQVYRPQLPFEVPSTAEMDDIKIEYTGVRDEFDVVWNPKLGTVEGSSSDGPIEPSGEFSISYFENLGAAIVTYEGRDTVAASEIMIEAGGVQRTWATLDGSGAESQLTGGSAVELSSESEFGAEIAPEDTIAVLWTGGDERQELTAGTANSFG